MADMIGPRPLLASLTRISDLAIRPYQVQSLPRAAWAAGDYVMGQVTRAGGEKARLELACGREMSPVPGDAVVGALGSRAATLEAVGDWRSIGDDGLMEALTAAGLMGRVTSQSQFMGNLIQCCYAGHLFRDGRQVAMGDFVPQDQDPSASTAPIVLIIGTSMSSGKTVSGQVLVRMMATWGWRVAGVKLTGAGRYRDILSLQDAGAAAVFDFVDAGLPSTVCPPDEYRQALRHLMRQVEAAAPDVVVAEAGASPLEPYNGQTALQEIRQQIALTILCASDPYAVVGVTKGFGFQPDLVAGVATSTSAGREVVQQLAGLSALNLTDPATEPELERLLRQRLGGPTTGLAK